MTYGVVLPVLLPGAFAACWFASSVTPTLGASAVVFAMVGLNMAGCRDWRHWLLLVASLSIGFVIPSVNGAVHIAAFIPGYFTGGAILFYRRIRNDCRTVNSGE
jgi:hypothetical protein